MSRSLALTIALASAFILSSPSVAQNDPAAPDSIAGRQIQSLQRRMAADSDLMDTVSELQSDPEFQKMLDDPDIAAAVQSGNYDALLSNPKISGLASHPKVQELTRKLTQ